MVVVRYTRSATVGVGTFVGVGGMFVGVGTIVDAMVGKTVGERATDGVTLFCARRMGAGDEDGCPVGFETACVGDASTFTASVGITVPPPGTSFNASSL